MTQVISELELKYPLTLAQRRNICQIFPKLLKHRELARKNHYRSQALNPTQNGPNSQKGTE